MFTLEAIERDIESTESQIASLQQTLATLRQMRGLALNLGSPAKFQAAVKPVTDKKRVIRDRPGLSEEQPRSKRDTMRAITVQMEGDFTLNDLEAATLGSNLKLAPTLNKQDWSACLWTFYKQGLLEMVEERRGNLPAVYRLKTKDLSPPPSDKESEFPLQEMLLKAIDAVQVPQFGRKEIFAKVVEMNPAHADRITLDSVSAVLNRISRFENSPVKTIKTGPGGNVYTHADKLL